MPKISSIRPDADRTFAEKAAAGGAAEVESGKLAEQRAAEFDRAYMDPMVKDHQTVVAAFQKEASSGKDAQLKAFAAKTLPTLQDHLKMATATNAEARKAKP